MDRFKCECGSIVLKGNKGKHIKTKKHKELIDGKKQSKKKIEGLDNIHNNAIDIVKILKQQNNDEAINAVMPLVSNIIKQAYQLQQ